MKRTLFCSIAILLSFQAFSYAALQISTDKTAISFGLMQLEEEKELTQYGDYHHEIVCSSTNDNTWNLEISLLQPLSSGQDEIPLECFKWQLVATDGHGSVANPYQFKEFNLSPDLVYISAPDENNGELVHLQFKYSLKIPEAQTSGNYNTIIRFTITELL